MAESTESAHPAGVVHEVDGIQEEDNRLPRWWLATFFVAIAFGYGYWEYFQVFHLGGTPLSDYREAVALEKKSHPPATVAPADSDQALIAMSKGGVEEGQAVFTTTCVACHGVSGEGKIGPNLTDAYWLHGGKPSDVLASVSHGYPLKGMPAWLPTLGPTRVRQVAAFVLSLGGKNLPGKGAQGILVKADGTTVEAPPLSAAAEALLAAAPVPGAGAPTDASSAGAGGDASEPEAARGPAADFSAYAELWWVSGPHPAKRAPAVAQPVLDPNDPMVRGRVVFTGLCATCHQANAMGIPGAFPPLSKSDFLMADKERSIGVVLRGLNGPVTVNGANFVNAMPPQSQLSDRDIASVLTFVRSSFGNSGEPVTPKEVKDERAKLPASASN